jgi:hypothetical protein
MVSNGRQRLSANLISRTDSRGKENAAKETGYATYTWDISDALAHFCLITLKTETYRKTVLAGNVCYIFPCEFC